MERRRPIIVRLVSAGAVAALLGLGACGMKRLESTVLRSPARQAPPRIELVDVPAELEEIVVASLDGFTKVPWSSRTLCADIAAELEGAGWIQRVERVQRFCGGRVEVRCRFRTPAAMVQSDDEFYLVDADCIRLPGQYANHPSLVLIQGVKAAVPPAGCEWAGPDLRAGVEVARLVYREPFVGQIVAVLVQNFGGRLDPRRAHLELATDRAGGRILWGTAPGGEIEENSVAQKLELLRSNYRRFGRADADRPVIDISVHPDAVIAPLSGLGGDPADGAPLEGVCGSWQRREQSQVTEWSDSCIIFRPSERGSRITAISANLASAASDGRMLPWIDSLTWRGS